MTRRAWQYVIAGYMVMAVGFVIVAFLHAHEIRQINADEQRLMRQEQELRRDDQALEGLAVRNTTLTCLLATAPGGSNAARKKLLEYYVESGQVPPVDKFGPLCPEVVMIARQQLADHEGAP